MIFNKDRFQAHLTAATREQTLRECAVASGISAPTLSRLLTADHMPDLVTFCKACEWMQAPPALFFDGTPIHEAHELRWQLRMVLEFYQTPPAELLKQAPDNRYGVLIEAWRLAKGDV